jgi:G3E family GTPase
MSIPFHLVTGFLGSGKTAFLMHYLNTYGESRKVGVIQNEFSPAGVDGTLVRNSGGAYRLLEVNNGSVFCVCLLGSFIDSLAAFLDAHEPDEIIMEASGMSDPISIGQIFQSEKLKNRVFLGQCWSVVDALNFDRVKAIRSRLENQIRVADVVVINKCDLIPQPMDGLKAAVRKINPFARIEMCTFGQIALNNASKARHFFPAAMNDDSHRPDLQSAVIRSTRLITLENLHRFVDGYKSKLIRCKGYVNVGPDQKIFVQGVFETYSFLPVEWFAGNTELVMIGHFNETEIHTHHFEYLCHT